MAVLQPVAHLCGQAQAGLNQCIVIDCSLSLPTKHKPLTHSCSNYMYHVTYQ